MFNKKLFIVFNLIFCSYTAQAGSWYERQGENNLQIYYNSQGGKNEEAGVIRHIVISKIENEFKLEFIGDAEGNQTIMLSLEKFGYRQSSFQLNHNLLPKLLFSADEKAKLADVLRFILAQSKAPQRLRKALIQYAQLESFFQDSVSEVGVKFKSRIESELQQAETELKILKNHSLSPEDVEKITTFTKQIEMIRQILTLEQ